MKVIISGVVAGIATAALVSLGAAAHADGGQTVMIRPGGFDPQLSDTRATGHVDFLKEGLHVWTEGNTSTDKAAEYVDVPGSPGLPSTASLTWYGTDAQPGSQIVFDTNSDRTDAGSWNVLVGEKVYGDDFWYTGGSAKAATNGITCPETTGGSGSDCHGTLAEWQAAVPTAEVYAAGFSLGSGVKGDGVLHDLQIGDTDYQFTSEPVQTVVPVTGSANVTRVDYRHSTQLRIRFSTDPLGANEVQGQRLHFVVRDNGQAVYRATLGAGSDSFLKLRYADGTGTHRVQILENGEVTQTVVVKSGR